MGHHRERKPPSYMLRYHGTKEAACVLIEGKLRINLLYFGCRHHEIELVLGAAFKSIMVIPSSGPDMALFNMFQSGYDQIDKITHDSGLSDDTVRSKVLGRKNLVFTEPTINRWMTIESFWS